MTARPMRPISPVLGVCEHRWQQRKTDDPHAMTGTVVGREEVDEGKDATKFGNNRSAL